MLPTVIFPLAVITLPGSRLIRQLLSVFVYATNQIQLLGFSRILIPDSLGSGSFWIRYSELAIPDTHNQILEVI